MSQEFYLILLCSWIDDVFQLDRLKNRTHKAQNFLGNLYTLASINVGPPHPTLIWSQPGLEPTTQ